jgi:hypothetical protein
MNPLDYFAGYKSYIVGAGLIGLALYQLSTGDLSSAGQSLMAGLGLFFARRAVER